MPIQYISLKEAIDLVKKNGGIPVQIDYLHKKTKGYKLLIKCGSYFHGKNKPGIEIGMCNCTIDEIQLIKNLSEF